MINLFQFAPNDQALSYMAQIFGYMNGVIPVTGVVGVTSTGAATSTYSGAAGPSITLLGTMFQTFNTIILAVAVLVVVYITVMGVLMTAHEGEVMKKWHSLWTPIRTVLGIAFLVPTASGYCILQMIMMWVIVQGVGAADTLWNTVLGYVNIAGSPYAQVTVPSVGYQSTLNQLFQGLVCEQTAMMGTGTTSVTGTNNQTSYYCSANSSSQFCGMTTNQHQQVFDLLLGVGGAGLPAMPAGMPLPTSMPLGPGGSCGLLTWCNASTFSPTSASSSSAASGACSATNGGSTGLQCQACQAEITALSNIYPVLLNVAQLFAQADASYISYITASYATQTYTYTKSDGSTATYTGSGTAPTPPTWIQNYCTAKGISPCTRDKASGEGLPDPNIASGSAPQSTVTNLYWQYYLLPQLGSSSNFMQTVTADFGDGLNALFAAFTAQMAASLANPTTALAQNTDLANAASTGWILAGSYYYTIAKMNQNNLQDVMPLLTYDFSYTNSSPPNSPGNPLYDMSYRNNYSAASSLLGVSEGSGSSMSGSNNLPSSTSDLTSVASEVTSAIQTTTEGSLSGTSNPLVQAQQAGYAILMIAQIGYFIFIGLVFVIGLMGNLSVYVLGTGVANPVGPAIQLMFLIVVPAVVALFGIMVTLGATLSVYLPLVPFIIFSFGAIGWLTSTIETMVAGPLVALGVIAPGHHEIMGKAEPAIMLLFNVFLRPSLMIFGLVAAMLLASVVVAMINGAFWQVMTSISAGSSSSTSAGVAASVMSPLTMILFLCAYVTMVISALNKCFAAIHIIPEKVTRWISQQGGEQYGESEALGDIKGGVGAGAKGAGSAAETGGKAPEITSKGDREQKAFNAEEKRQDAAKKTPGAPTIGPGDGK